MTKGMYITIRLDSDPGPLVTEHFRYMGLVQIGGLGHTGKLCPRQVWCRADRSCLAQESAWVAMNNR